MKDAEPRRPVRVGIADDSGLFREGLSMLLRATGAEVVIEARTGLELQARLRHPAQVDVVIVDLRMPPTFSDEGLACAIALREAHHHLGVILLSTYAHARYAVRLLEHGDTGVGYLLKDRVTDVSMLLDAIARVCAGEVVVDPVLVRGLVEARSAGSAFDGLTDRERQVLELMAQGRSNVGISQELYMAPKTVEAHIRRIFQHLALPEGSNDNRRVLAVLSFLRTFSG